MKHAERVEDYLEHMAAIERAEPEFVIAHPQLPWIEMRGMRNKMIHNYFDVDLEIVCLSTGAAP